MEALQQQRAGAARFRLPDRVRIVAVAIAAPLALWVIAEPILGMDLRSPAGGSRASQDIGPVHVIVAAGVASFAAWAALAILEHVTTRSRKIWTVTATLVLLVIARRPAFRDGHQRGQPGGARADAPYSRSGFDPTTPQHSPRPLRG